MPRPSTWTKSIAVLLSISLSTPIFGAEVSSFYRTNSVSFPSYLVTKKDEFILRLNQPETKAFYHIKNNIIDQATVERWFKKYRVAVQFKLVGSKYKITKAYVTNISALLKVEHIDPINVCTLTQSDIDKIARVIESTDYASNFVDNSCPSSGTTKLTLSRLRLYLSPASEQGKDFLNCLAKMSSDSQYSDLREQLIDLRASIIATMKKESNIPQNIKVSCIKCRSNTTCPPSRTEVKDGFIGVPVNEDDTPVVDDLKEFFLHELVHGTHPLLLVSHYEDELATVTSKICTGKVYQRKRFVETDESISNTSQSLKPTPVNVRTAVASLEKQTVDSGTLVTLGELAKTSTPQNADAINAAFEDAVAKPTRAFSRTTDALAKAFIPEANAALESTTLASGSLASGSTSSSGKRSPAAIDEPSPITTSNFNYKSSNSTANNEEKLVEEIIVPTPDGNSYNSKISVTKAPAPHLTIGNEISKTPEFKKTQSEAPQSTPNSTTPPLASASSAPSMGSASAGLTNSLSSLSAESPVSRGPASVKGTSVATSARTSGAAFNGTIAGITFSQGNITGAGYQKYQAQMSQPAFKQSLEKAGILITRNGKLLSKPKSVVATYIDNGSSLIYGGL